MLIQSFQWRSALAMTVLVYLCSLSDCYDPLDPTGNITVTFDIHRYTDIGYLATVTIQNFYQYRHVDKPGWKLGWTWANNEVIWSMSGAFATQQGNCSSFKFQIPHCCKRNPEIVDLMPDALPENRSENCCRGGLLYAYSINPSNSFSSFEITVGNLENNSSGNPPLNLTLMAPGYGYTCGPVLDVDPSVCPVIGGRREEQALRTWKSACTYSSFLANKTPLCCASLSTFYNRLVTPCPQCSCGCREAKPTSALCYRGGDPKEESATSDLNSMDLVHCTDHMCPVRVHWHIKNNYQDYWRVKLTVSNYNYAKNFSNWNVLVQHPGFGQTATTYSFNSTLLPSLGFADEVALFWGLEHYNTELINAGERDLGSVTTEILLKKNFNSFTLSNGWAFPRRVYFNGENCQMPLPDTYPMLPNGGISQMTPTHGMFSLVILVYLTFETSVLQTLNVNLH